MAKNRLRDRERHRQRYATDPVYRVAKLAKDSARKREHYAIDPNYVMAALDRQDAWRRKQRRLLRPFKFQRIALAEAAINRFISGR